MSEEDNEEYVDTRDLAAQACENNDLEALKSLLSNDLDVNDLIFKDHEGYPLVYYAHLNDSKDIVDYLLDHPDIDLNYAFRYAIDKEKPEDADFFIKCGADVNGLDKNSHTVLVNPITADMAKYILSIGFDAKTAILHRQTSLDTIKALVEAGADVDFMDSIQYTPLMRYLSDSRLDINVVEYLASRSSKLTHVDTRYNSTPLSCAFHSATDMDDEERHLLGAQVVQILLKYGAKPVFNDFMEVRKHPDLVRLLLEGKGDPNPPSTRKIRGKPLSLVSLFKMADAHPDSIETLKEFGAVGDEDDV